MLLSDERLTRRAIGGDQRALTAIFARYQEPLYRYCLAIVGDRQDAEDALQSTMLKVLRALPGEERRIELKPWLYRIAHNESVELIRRRRPSEELDTELLAGGAGLAEEASQRERLRHLLADLEQLPERQRGALVMRELGGLGFEEIGAALGTSAAVARQTLYEARLGLREMDAGREMGCDEVMRAVSDADGRVLRRRDLRAHLRNCDACSRFRDELDGRQRDLAALSPLPVPVLVALGRWWGRERRRRLVPRPCSKVWRPSPWLRWSGWGRRIAVALFTSVCRVMAPRNHRARHPRNRRRPLQRLGGRRRMLGAAASRLRNR